MSFAIYHPTKNNTGFACSFQNSFRDNCVYATIVKQSSWDEQSGNGIFKPSLEDPEKNVSIKLSDLELSAILDCIERNRPFQSFHDNDSLNKVINFAPWLAKGSSSDPLGDTPSAPQQRGFSFSITVTKKQEPEYKNSFYIGLNFPEARLLRESLLFYVNNHFAVDEAKALASLKAKQSQQQAQTSNSPEVI